MASEAPKLAAWEDSDVQRLYEIFCADDLEHKPDDEHWEGYCSRWAVQSIVDPYRAKIAELERQLIDLRLVCDSQKAALNRPADIAIWQPKMVEWVRSRLGDSAMEPHERAMRFIEEAVELAQAVGLKVNEINRVVEHVYDKSPGRIGQEIGGVVTTLLTLSQAHDTEMNIAALMEIDRIHELPAERFQKRQALNAHLGIGAPLPPAPKEA